VLTVSREAAGGRRPDLVGAVALCAGVAALALAVVQGEAWGWTGGRVLGAVLVAALALAVLAIRSARHPSPVIEPALLRARGPRAANLSVFLFSMTFFSLLLVTVLFLTSVWRYSALEAGLAFAPGPLMVALLSGPTGALAGRVGARPLAVAGALLFAASCGWWIWRAGPAHAYAADLLPGIVVGGIGVSLIFPVLAGAAVAGLPPDRAATGSALFNMARQIGGVIGVAVAVAILGDGALEAGDFRAAWVFMVAASLAAALAALRIPARLTPRPAGVAPLRPTEGDEWATTSSSASGGMPHAGSPGCERPIASSSATAAPSAGSPAAG
jgi:MFS family permease